MRAAKVRNNKLVATEADVQRAIRDFCEALGCRVERNNAGAAMVVGRGGKMRPMRFGSIGRPDLEVLLPAWRCWGSIARVLFIECKRKGGRYRDSQVRWMADAERLGHWTLFADSVEAVYDYLRERGVKVGPGAASGGVRL